MKIDNLTYKQFAMIRRAIINEREKIWQNKFGCLIKNRPLKEIQDAKAWFNKITNQFTDYGICNVVLKEINKVEDEAQIALGMKTKMVVVSE